MNEEQNLIKIDDPKSLAEFIKQPEKILGFITGVLSSDRRDWVLSAGRLVQASIKWRLISQLGKEVKEYIDKGKIKEDYLEDHRNCQALHDILKFIDESVPDENRFKAIKALFLKSILSNTTESDKILSFQLMQISERLESGDLLVVKANYDLVNHRNSTGINNIDLNDTVADTWFKILSRQIGHNIPSLVELHEQNLMSLKLISQRVNVDKSGFAQTKYYRLTELGYKFCEFVLSE
jgi:hypothetical protein